MKDGFKEFATFDEKGTLYTSELPQSLPTTATIEGLLEYRANMDFEDDVDFDRLEIIEMDCIESGVIGADIRNKLSPPKNLLSLLEEYFGMDDGEKKEKLLIAIEKEMKRTKKNLEYIAQIL